MYRQFRINKQGRMNTPLWNILIKPNVRVIAILASLMPFQIFAATFDAATDFSASNNPNSAWSYGWTQTLGSSLNVYPDPGNLAGLDVWNDLNHISLGVPHVAHNGTANTMTPGTFTYQPGQLGFHPGSNGEFSVIRWTAPSASTYTIAASFTGIDTHGTTTDVHVLKDGSSLFTGDINGFGSIAQLSPIALSLLAGDTIDFAVGFGSNGNYFFDSTGVNATINSQEVSNVPIPAGIWLFGSALTGLFVKGRRKK